jgi:hypothetical protein
VQTVAAEYAVQREAEADTAGRERLTMWLPLQLTRDFTPEVCELAMKAVTAALAELPVGTPREQLEKVRDAALAPFYAALAERRRLLREQADAERKKLWASMQTLFQPPPTQLHRAPVVNRRRQHLGE